MEKYGVDVDPTANKTAGTKEPPRCRACDAKLVEASNVPKCIRCGTRPYEVRND